jgi:hypothetical protein
LVLIPGNLKFLKQHFGVSVVVFNYSDPSAAVLLKDVSAHLLLPEPEEGGLPLSINVPPTQRLLAPGSDGQTGTGDDLSIISAGQKGSCSYVVTGNLEGTYPISMEIKGKLDLPQGEESFDVNAETLVRVRSPFFQVTFEHPDAVVANEPFEVKMTVKNTSNVAVEDLSIQLDSGSGPRLTGCELAEGSPVNPSLGRIEPGEESAVTFLLFSRLSGKVLGSYAKTTEGMAGSLACQIAVGEFGQAVAPVFFSWPQLWQDTFPENIRVAVESLTKQAFDVSQTREEERLPWFSPLTEKAVREWNRQLVFSAQSQAWGTSPELASMELMRSLVDPGNEFAPLDVFRRKAMMGETIASELENHLGNWFSQLVPEHHWRDWPKRFAQHFPDLSAQMGFFLHCPGATFSLVDAQGKRLSSDGERNLPFASCIALSGDVWFVWASQGMQNAQLTIEPNQNNAPYQLSWVFAHQDQAAFWSVEVEDVLYKRTRFQVNAEMGALTWETEGSQQHEILGLPVAPLPFELEQVIQMDSVNSPETGVDAYGRDLLLIFSKPVVFSSLNPQDG